MSETLLRLCFLKPTATLSSILVYDTLKLITENYQFGIVDKNIRLSENLCLIPSTTYKYSEFIFSI